MAKSDLESGSGSSSGSGSRSRSRSESPPPTTPLLSSTRTRTRTESNIIIPPSNNKITTTTTSEDDVEHPNITHVRHTLQTRLSSNTSHYFIIILVSVDIGCIFADFLISLHVCEHSCQSPGRPTEKFNPEPFERAASILSDISLTISCLFMVELIVNIFAFGFNGYFFSSSSSSSSSNSGGGGNRRTVKKFHVVDAVVIVLGLVIDLALRGPVEEAGSLIVILRLWRVVKIVEEFGEGAEDGMEGLEREVETLKVENEVLRKRLIRATEGDGKGR